MSTESTPAPQTGVAEDGHKGQRIAVSALVTNLREYGLVLALIAIMIFFQFTTNGTLFKPVNLSNLVQQNSFIIVMALMVLLWARPAPGTPGFVITVLTLLMGTGFGAVVVLLARFSQRKR